MNQKWFVFLCLLASFYLPFGTLSGIYYCRDHIEKRAQYRRLLPMVMFNTTGLLPLWIYYLLKQKWIFVNKNQRYPVVLSQLVGELMVFGCLFEISFYTLHRLMHRVKYFFNKIHSVHHELKEPVGFGSLYCHPVEFVMCNLLSMTIGPLAFSRTVTLHALCAWITFGTSAIVITHSGHWPNDHLKHHRSLNGEYGTTGLLDWLCATKL